MAGNWKWSSLSSFWKAAVVVILVIAALMLCSWYNKRASGSATTALGGGNSWAGGCCGQIGGDDDDDLDIMGGVEGYVGGGIDGGERVFRMFMRPPWHKLAAAGKATMVGRVNRRPFDKIKAGDPIVIARSRKKDDQTEYGGERNFDAEVVEVKKYKDYGELLKKHLKDIFPGSTQSEAMESLSEFSSAADEKEHGVLAIKFKKLA